MDVNASRIRVSSTIGVYSRTSILGPRGREALTVLCRPVAQRSRLPGHGPSSGDSATAPEVADLCAYGRRVMPN